MRTGAVPEARARPRLAVWLRRRRLDADLARGANPLESPALGLRARQLGEPAQRHCLATAIERALDHVRRPPRRSGLVAPGDLDRAAQHHLERIACRLRSNRPIGERGDALVSELVSDGTGPLYNPGDESPAARPGGAGSALPLLTKQPRSGALDHGRELCRQRRRKWWTTALGRRSRVNTPLLPSTRLTPETVVAGMGRTTAWRDRSSAIPRATPSCSAVA